MHYIPVYCSAMDIRKISYLQWFGAAATVVSLAIFIQEPLLLALNPTLAILGISLNSIQKTKLND